jgi:thiamine pyrophosphokinase
MGAGEYFGSFTCNAGDLIIAADGGLDRLRTLGIEPDIIIGDFDSAETVPEGGNVVVLPHEKDDTDTLAAVRYGLAQDIHEFHIWGGTGGRADHTAANIQVLAFLSKNDSRGFLYGDGMIIIAVTNGSIIITGERGRYVSVFSHSDVSYGVTLSGLRYPLDSATLTNTFPVGVSNEFTCGEAEITVEIGTLIIYRQI